MDYVVNMQTREIVGRLSESVATGSTFRLPPDLDYLYVPSSQHTEEEIEEYYTLPIVRAITFA